MEKYTGRLLNAYHITFIVFLLGNALNAQTVDLHITIKTVNGHAPDNASIQLYALPDTFLLQSRVSLRGDNIFRIRPLKNYLIKVSAIGYDSVKRSIYINDQAVFITLTMAVKTNELKTVTVVSKKAMLKQDGDKTIVDAEVLAGSSTNAYEVLEKTPGAIVDQDGNVYLNSATPATVYINGREFRMSANDLATLLKSLPAGIISKIEILRTPSARYEAAKSGGIINLVLKRSTITGTTGNVNIRVDQGVYNTVSAGFGVNRSREKIKSWLSYQYTNRNAYEEIQSERLTDSSTLLRQRSFTKYSTPNHFINAGIDIQCSKKLNVAYDMRLNAVRNFNRATSYNDFIDTLTGNKFMQIINPISNKGNSWVIDNTITTKYQIDTAGSEWINELTYTYSNNNNSQVYTTHYQVPVSDDRSGKGTMDQRMNVLSYKSDLSITLPRNIVFEAGLKYNLSENRNADLYYKQTASLQEKTDSFLTNTLQYKDRIGAAYIQLSKVVKNITVKAGVRYENTGISGVQLVPVHVKYSISRNDLFPYLYLKRRLFVVLGYPLTGNMIFRRSITRPDYEALNPVPKYVDQYTYDVGNSRLRPQFTTNYEVNATYNDFPVFAFGVNNTSNVFSRVTYKDDTSRIVFRTFDNLGRFREIYGRLFGGLPPGRRYFMYAGVQCNYIHYEGNYQEKPLNYQRTSWSFFTGHSLKITPDLNIHINGWMYVNGFRVFNELGTMGQLNISVNKTMLQKKVTLLLSANDILKTNRSDFHIRQAGLFVNGSRIQDSRKIGITLRYNFGSFHTEEKAPAFVPDTNNVPANF